ncbi:MAG: hypothetical protein KJO22_09060, partial [Bacteroidia bacterium]|nr:hypothetical protein [Bacteroidia bacterium]
MKTFRLIIGILIIASCQNIFSQSALNQYKYIVIPNQFDFLKGRDQFQINSLTKFLFNKNGFKALLDDDKFPEDLFNDRCLAAYANVLKVKGGFLRTKLQIEIKDCYGEVLYVSEIGSTKEKLYEKAYNIAVRKAFESVNALGYNYKPKESKPEKQVVKKKNIVTNNEVISKPKNTEIIKAEKPTGVTQKVELIKNDEIKEVLYAQEIEGGFQLVDSEPKVVMILLKTAAENVFTVKGKDAVVFKKGDQWIYS